MLDTDTVSYALRGEGLVGARLLEHTPSSICASSITLAELRFGVARRRSRKLAGLVDRFFGAVAVVPFDAAAADEYGPLAAELLRRGTPLGGFDTLIAAHARSLGLVLVTRNTKHFGRIHGLASEDWYA